MIQPKKIKGLEKMTAFDKNTHLPGSVNTVEKLAVWACTVLNYLYPTEKIFEIVGEAPELVATAQVFDIPLPDENWDYTDRTRFIGRVSLPIDKTAKTGTPYWQAAGEIGSESIPPFFNS